MPKIVELRSERSFIRSNFDGYKLSLDPVPVLRQELSTAPHKAEPSEDQYSLLHAELFSMQNLLQVDPWARTSSYYVNSLGEVVRTAYSETFGRADALQVVYRLAKHTPRVKGDYNYSMRFISEKYCVLCDGIENIYLLDTNDRLKEVEWKLIAETCMGASDETIPERNYSLYDCRLDIVQEEKQISLAIGRIKRLDTFGGGSNHFMHLHWAKWVQYKEWLFTIIDTLESKGSLYYCAFEPRADSLIICSNHPYIFRSQKASEENNAKAENLQLLDEPSKLGEFTWAQTDDDIIIKFDVKETKEKTDYNVKYANNKLTVKCNEEVLLDSGLFATVDQNLTTWSIENNCLLITIVKQTSSLYWPSLFPNGLGPQETFDSNKQADLPMDQKPIVNLEAPIEDCDFPMGSNEEDLQIGRYHMPTKSVTHAALLGSTPPLFSTNLRPGFPNALALRQDVDAGLWLQQYNPSKPDYWSLRHEGNLHAFGYIQASKQQRKFIDCSPDLSYALICESHRHIFVYKSNYDEANGLRNRNGPQVRIGKQHLITLEDAGEVLGLTTAQSVVTILTERYVLYLQIV